MALNVSLSLSPDADHTGQAERRGGKRHSPCSMMMTEPPPPPPPPPLAFTGRPRRNALKRRSETRIKRIARSPEETAASRPSAGRKIHRLMHSKSRERQPPYQCSPCFFPATITDRHVDLYKWQLQARTLQHSDLRRRFRSYTQSAHYATRHAHRRARDFPLVNWFETPRERPGGR